MLAEAGCIERTSMLLARENLPLAAQEMRSSFRQQMSTATVLATRWLTKNNDVLSHMAARVERQHEIKWQSGHFSGDKPVREVLIEELKTQSVLRAIKSFKEPIVIRDFAAKSTAVKTWRGGPANLHSRLSGVSA